MCGLCIWFLLLSVMLPRFTSRVAGIRTLSSSPFKVGSSLEEKSLLFRFLSLGKNISWEREIFLEGFIVYNRTYEPHFCLPTQLERCLQQQ